MVCFLPRSTSQRWHAPFEFSDTTGQFRDTSNWLRARAAVNDPPSQAREFQTSRAIHALGQLADS